MYWKDGRKRQRNFQVEDGIQDGKVRRLKYKYMGINRSRNAELIPGPIPVTDQSGMVPYYSVPSSIPGLKKL